MYDLGRHHVIRLAICHVQRLIYSRIDNIRVHQSFLSLSPPFHTPLTLCAGSFGSGAYVSLCTLPVMAFGEMEDVGRRVGMSLTILASGALAGPPISGAINAATGDFKAVGYYAGMAPSAPLAMHIWLIDLTCVGGMIVLAVMLMVLTRQLHLNWKLWGKF